MADTLVNRVLQRAGMPTTPRPWRTQAAVLLIRDPRDMYADWSAWKQWVIDNDCEGWEDMDDQDAEIDLYSEHWRQVDELAGATKPWHIVLI